MKAPVGLLKFFGKFTNKFNYGANIIEALNNYPEKFEAEKTWQDLGKPQVKFIDYIKKIEKRRLLTSVWRNGGGRASYEHLY